MEYLVFNISWMTFNVLLALVPVIFTMILDKKTDQLIRVPLLILWLLFLPNTIYLLTDIQHIIPQLFLVDQTGKVVLFAQYATIIFVGILTYMYSLKPFELLLNSLKIVPTKKKYWYIILNLILGFAVVLGKVQRTHSWYVFTDPLRVATDIINTLTSPQLMVLTILFGAIFSVIYFPLRKLFTSPIKRKKK